MFLVKAIVCSEQNVVSVLDILFDSIWNTFKYQVTVFDFPLYVCINFPIELNFTVVPLKSRSAILIRYIKRNPDLDQLRLVIIIDIDPCLELCISLLLKVTGNKAVSVPIEYEETDEEYGSDLSHR